MGNFRVTVNAVGGHGCQRDIKDGQEVQEFCGGFSCPDCLAREFVRTLKRSGNNVLDATLQHWPETPSEVKDDLLTRKRTGSF